MTAAIIGPPAAGLAVTARDFPQPILQIVRVGIKTTILVASHTFIVGNLSRVDFLTVGQRAHVRAEREPPLAHVVRGHS